MLIRSASDFSSQTPRKKKKQDSADEKLFTLKIHLNGIPSD